MKSKSIHVRLKKKKKTPKIPEQKSKEDLFQRVPKTDSQKALNENAIYSKFLENNTMLSPVRNLFALDSSHKFSANESMPVQKILRNLKNDPKKNRNHVNFETFRGANGPKEVFPNLNFEMNSSMNQSGSSELSNTNNYTESNMTSKLNIRGSCDLK